MKPVRVLKEARGCNKRLSAHTCMRYCRGKGGCGGCGIRWGGCSGCGGGKARVEEGAWACTNIR